MIANRVKSTVSIILPNNFVDRIIEVAMDRVWIRFLWNPYL